MIVAAQVVVQAVLAEPAVQAVQEPRSKNGWFHLAGMFEAAATPNATHSLLTLI